MILDSLLGLAQRKNASVGIPAALIGTVNLLQLSGSAFNKQCCADMVATHEKGFQMMVLGLGNSEVKVLISASLPHLISHLEWAMGNQENLGPMAHIRRTDCGKLKPIIADYIA